MKTAEKLYIEKKDSLVYIILKRFFDIILSILLLIITLPISLVSILLIFIIDKQNPFYSSVRVGRYGKEFHIYKFRTMKNSDASLEEIFNKDEINTYKKNYKISNDPRVTKIGKFLRKTSIDEIPQVINILKGEMSLVGPRPVLQEETYLYGENREQLLSVKPGLTGYWQATGRNTLDYESGKRQNAELYYIQNRCILLDFKIILLTFKAAITMYGAM